MPATRLKVVEVSTYPEGDELLFYHEDTYAGYCLFHEIDQMLCVVVGNIALIPILKAADASETWMWNERRRFVFRGVRSLHTLGLPIEVVSLIG
jgi:hypothetical protein